MFWYVFAGVLFFIISMRTIGRYEKRSMELQNDISTSQLAQELKLAKMRTQTTIELELQKANKDAEIVKRLMGQD